MDVARSTVKLFFAKIANAAIQFIGIAYFARELGATAMGVFFLFQVVLGMIAIPADFGLRRAVEKRVSEGENQGQFLASAIVIKLIPISFFIGLVFLVGPYLEQYIGADVTIYLAAAVVLQESSKLSISVLKGELRVGETAVLQVSRNLTWVVVGIYFVSIGFEAEALIYGLLAGMAIVTLWGWHKVTISPSIPTVDQARSLFDYGKYSAISSIGGYLYSWTDIAIIGLFLTQAHVGSYEIAWRVSAISLLFGQAVASTIFPQVSEWDAENDQDRIGNLVTKALTPALFFVIPALFGTILFAEEILELVFGQEYTIAATVLVILMIGKIFEAVQLVVGRSLQAIDKPNLAARAAIGSLSVNVILNVVLVSQYGILGAAVATVTSAMLNDVLLFRYLRNFISIEFPWREILEIVTASGVMVIALYVASIEYTTENLSQLSLLIIFGVISYFITILFMPRIRDRFLEQVTVFRF